jgi:subtilisin family serine protease
MEANTSRQLARVRSMVGMIAPLILIAGVVFAGHEQTVNRKIILFREGTTPQVHRHVVERHGYKVLHHLRRLNAVTITLPDDKAAMTLAALQGDRRVVGVYSDPEVSADHVVSITPVRPPSVEIFPWGVERIGVPPVFKLVASQSTSAPIVAILDTGIDIRHPELVRKIAGGYNARAGENPSDYQDHNGHGTHMAGIIAASWDGSGIIGTATYPKLVAVKVLDDTGHGYLSDLISGLDWILEQDIRVVNMSLSFSEGSPLLAKITQQLYAAGVIMVASAGNRCVGESEDEGADDEGGDSGCTPSRTASVKFPAAYPEVIAVVATDSNNKLTDYSRNGPEADVAAPGGDKASKQILSTTISGGYGEGKGTSQAAAHVTGGVAVALQLAPWLSVEEVVDLLKGTARDLDDAEPHRGVGLLAVDNVVKKLLGLP